MFSFKEFQAALDKAHDSFPDQDKNYYQFLEHLPDTTLSISLDIFNDILQKGDLPFSWKEALVIPIPKSGKDTSDPDSYRPKALTSYLC